MISVSSFQDREGKQKGEVKKEKKVKKLYPDSPLFSNWNAVLTEEEELEAEQLFQKYGYNTFLSNRLPLDRELPETRHYRSAVCSTGIQLFAVMC